MKCLNCGARVKKSEEICPECGAYISTERPDVTNEISENDIDIEVLETAEEAVRNIDEGKSEEYNFGDYLFLPSILRIGGGLVVFVIFIVSIVNSPLRNEATSAFALIFSFFAVFSGIASIIQEHNCKLTINDERVYGIIPQGFFGTETIDINIEDIIGINETGFHSKNSSPKVHIVTKETEYVVKGSSKIMLKDLSNTLQEKVKNLKGDNQ